METERLEKMLGLAYRARLMSFGQGLVLSALQALPSSHVSCVLLACDASARTAGQITNKCTYYQIPLFALPISSDIVGHALGKEAPVAVVSINDSGFAKQIISLLN